MKGNYDCNECYERYKRDEIFQRIIDERERQEEMHPFIYSDLYFLAVLMEEVGEVSKAIQETSNLEEELIQVAAVCVRWIESRT